MLKVPTIFRVAALVMLVGVAALLLNGSNSPAITTVDAQTNTDWPQLQRDPARTGRTSISVVPGNTAKWVWVDENNVTSNFVSQTNASIKYPAKREVILAGNVQPIVADNKVFFGAVNGQFFALNGTTGATVWKQQLGGAVLHTAAYDQGIVVTGAMDGAIYGFNANTGQPVWKYQTGAGISVAPLVLNNTVYIGSRDGYFYAINITTGTLKWKYRTVADTETHAFSQAPILQPASSDGTRIFFGAENMYFYALDMNTGNELWREKLSGTSFQYSWPVVSNGLVMTFVSVPDGNSEFLMESVLDALPAKQTGESNLAYAQRIGGQEAQAIRDWLAQNPIYKNFFVMNVTNGDYPFTTEVAMGRVGGIGAPNRAPVIDNQNRILLYWRVRSTTFITGGTFGTKYTPDISAMDPLTGNRVPLTTGSGFNTELDNTFTTTVGGSQLYLNNHMRGAHTINLSNSQVTRITSVLANWDGGNFRGWGNKLIWLGNDSNSTYSIPPSAYRSPQGDSGVVIATINGVPTMFIQESGHYQVNFGALAAVQQ